MQPSFDNIYLRQPPSLGNVLGEAMQYESGCFCVVTKGLIVVTCRPRTPERFCPTKWKAQMSVWSVGSGGGFS